MLNTILHQFGQFTCMLCYSSDYSCVSFYLFREVNSFLFISDVTLSYEVNPYSIVNEEHKNEEVHINSLLYILQDLLNHIEERYYEGIIIYMTSMILRLLDRIKQKHNDKALLSEVLGIRNSITKRTLSDCRLILFAFSLIMYQPFINIFKLKFFRHNYHKATFCVYELAAFFSPIHSLFKRHKATDNNTYKGWNINFYAKNLEIREEITTFATWIIQKTSTPRPMQNSS